MANSADSKLIEGIAGINGGHQPHTQVPQSEQISDGEDDLNEETEEDLNEETESLSAVG